MTTDPASGKVNTEANLMAHAVLGAVVAQINGSGALAGAAGATTGEYIAQQLYPDVARDKLTEAQRQTISALGTLAAGLAGGIAGGDTAGAVAGAQAGKTSLENNALGCAGSSNPYCVGKNDLLTTGGGGPGPVAGGVGAAGALATGGDKEGEGSKTETLPVNDDLTGGKLENPGHQGEQDTSLTTPDQRDP